jgi:hypothetical protein
MVDRISEQANKEIRSKKSPIYRAYMHIKNFRWCAKEKIFAHHLTGICVYVYETKKPQLEKVPPVTPTLGAGSKRQLSKDKRHKDEPR